MRFAAWLAVPLARRLVVRRKSSQPHVYDAPALYDAAFGFRDFADEVDFLFAAHERHGKTGGAPQRVLELAAGPARHAVEAASRGARSHAIDLSPAMAAHGAAIVRAASTAPPAAQARPRCQRASRPLRPTPRALKVESIFQCNACRVYEAARSSFCRCGRVRDT